MYIPNQPKTSKTPQRKPKTAAADKALNFVIVLNVLMVIVAIGVIAVMPGARKAAVSAQSNNRLAALSSQNNAARLSSGGSSAERAALGGMTPTPTPLVQYTTGPVYEPSANQQGGTCISGHIIDVYHNQRGAGWAISIRADRLDAVPVELKADASGAFKLGGLGAGTYVVDLAVPEGWRPFTPATFRVTLNGVNENCAQVRFKMEALPCLVVYKRDDGGTFDLRDKVGIPGWRMFASVDGTTYEAVTDGEGKAVFNNLLPGTWTLREEARAGWAPADGQTIERQVTLVSPLEPGQCQVETFINRQVHTACIAAKKVDANNKPLQGWTMYLKHKQGTQPDQVALTDQEGFAYFTNLPIGDWIVREEVRDWWRSNNNTQQEITLTTDNANGLCPQVTFVNEALGCINGYKINHLEDGLNGWKITARNTKTGEELSTITNLDGYFQFKNITLGTWTVTEEVQEGWKAVTPSEFSLDVTEPFACKPARFKNRTDYACLDVYKRDSYDNAGIPGWVINLKPAYGGEMITGVTDGTGWVRFNQLIPGDYVLNEVMQAGWAPDGVTSTGISLENSGTCSVFTFYNHQTTRIVPTQVPGKQQGTTPCREYYTVKRGDTLNAIARLFGVPVKTLAEVNKIKNINLIHPNTTFCIPW